MQRHEKPIRFEAHAIERMRERGVSESQVRATVASPDTERPAKRPGARRLEKAISKRRRLIVIIDEEKTFVRIVTAYWQ